MVLHCLKLTAKTKTKNTGLFAGKEHLIFQLFSIVLTHLKIVFLTPKKKHTKTSNPPPTNLSRSLTPSVFKTHRIFPHPWSSLCSHRHFRLKARNSDANQFPCWYWVDQCTSHEANEWTYGNEGLAMLAVCQEPRTSLGGLGFGGSFGTHLKND